VTLRRDGNEARVAVRDSGIGMSPEQLAEVFDLFVQVDASLERTRGGLGIGLTLVRQLVEMHGGRVLARSEGLGKGSEFGCVPAAAGATPSSACACWARTGSGAVTPSLRVLVVDDNQDGADMLALSLSILGHEVLTLYDPLEVEAAAERFRPMLAFLDVGMPRLNGYDLAERLRARPWGRAHAPGRAHRLGPGQATAGARPHLGSTSTWSSRSTWRPSWPCATSRTARAGGACPHRPMTTDAARDCAPSRRTGWAGCPRPAQTRSRPMRSAVQLLQLGQLPPEARPRPAAHARPADRLPAAH
jgi:hypothetical protein